MSMTSINDKNLVAGLAALNDDSNTGVIAVVYSVGDTKKVLLKIAGTVEKLIKNKLKILQNCNGC